MPPDRENLFGKSPTYSGGRSHSWHKMRRDPAYVHDVEHYLCGEKPSSSLYFRSRAPLWRQSLLPLAAASALLVYHASPATMKAPLIAFTLSFLSPFRAIQAVYGYPFSGSYATRDSSRLSQAGTDLVQWDKYSLLIEGQRVFIQSGEFHAWRLPVVDLWPDIVEKFKAAGLNTMSIYVHWGLTNPTNGTTYWSGINDLQPIFDACKASGVWLIVRPGPYINAETTAGGIPGWVTTIEGSLRTDAPDYTATWQQYIKEVGELVAKNQISEGGPVIAVQVENEYITDARFSTTTGKDQYMQDLEDALRAAGIVVPLTYNDAYMGGNYATGLGAVDIFGFDSYPQSFDCSNPTVWTPVNNAYYPFHARTNPDQPFYIPEFQGGAFDPWGPSAPGYANCAILTGTDFESVFYLNNWAANIKMESFYMLYGGTSHGYLAFPGVYTSYDYGASISEDRGLRSKYTELKRQSLFLRASRDFYETDVIGNTTIGEVFATQLRNPTTNAGFYIVRNVNSTGLNALSFKLNVSTSMGDMNIPVTTSSIDLGPRESKVVVTDYKVGSSLSLLYSTAAILYAGKVGSRDVLWLYDSANSKPEVAVNGFDSSVTFDGPLDVHSTNATSGYVTITWTPNNSSFSLASTNSSLIVVSDKDAAGTVWNPTLSTPGGSKYYGVGTNDTILVWGPYLVRNASITDGVLALRGDLESATTVSVFAGQDLEEISWNGQKVSANYDSHGVYTFQVEPKIPALEPPTLGEWRYVDSLPEIKGDFDDSNWTLADRTTTNNPYKHYGGKYYLYACDYGFCNGAVLYRGHFNSSSAANGSAAESAVDLSLIGGEAFAATVWLNEVFLGNTYGNSSNNNNIVEETNQTYAFPTGSVKAGHNVITVVVDLMGMDETQSWLADSSKHPRGIRNYELVGGDSDSIMWKVQGQQGGFYKIPDTTRGITNENGFFAIRQGYHLPSEPSHSSSWPVLSPISSGLNTSGIGFFKTSFPLEYPEGYDILMSLNFGEETGQEAEYRAEVWVNGWQLGRRVANLGPQTKFVVHEGILDYQGENTLAVTLWAMGDQGAKIKSLEWKVDRAIAGGPGKVRKDNPGVEARVV